MIYFFFIFPVDQSVGIITSARLMEDRLSGSGTRINTVASSTSGLYAAGGSSISSATAVASGSPSVVGGPPSLSRNRSFSKHSLLEIVSNRISGGGGGTSSAESGGGGGGVGLTKRFSRESFSAACVNKTQQPQQQQQLLQANDASSSGTELIASSTTRRSRDARRRDLKNKLKLERNWDARQLELGGTSGGAHNFSSGGVGVNGVGASSGQRSGCRWTFVFDPAGRLCYYWSMVVSLAFLYNFWVLIYRFAFQEIASDTLVMWLCLDYFCDLVYVLDIAFHFRTGYLEEGVLQTDASKLRQHYMNSTTFYVDCLCLLPLDFLYLSIGFNSMLRCFRLVKIYRFWTFMDRTERHTNYPNVFRSISLVHYLLVIFHWNACLYRIVMRNNSFDPSLIREYGLWMGQPTDPNDGVGQYLQSFYLCTLTLTTTGGVLKPRTKGELLFVIIQLIFGLMLFATVLGHVSNIVINVSAARKEFQGTFTSHSHQIRNISYKWAIYCFLV
jgi:hypothetical protein